MATFKHMPRGYVVGSGNYVFRHYGEEVQPMPTKGQIITMVLGNAAPEYGTNNTYRVLSIDGSIAFVMAMFDQNQSIMFNNLSEGQFYSNSNLDNYLNSTWYNSLSSTAKTAIISTRITQYRYYYNTRYKTETHASCAGYSTKEVKQVVGNRYVYALDVEDIETYFDGTFGTADIFAFFWNEAETTSEVDDALWLRSAGTNYTSYAWAVACDEEDPGVIILGKITSPISTRPAFRIDLSKISWA